MPGQEERRAERYTLELSAKLSISSESSDPENIALKTTDISSSGAFFNTNRPLPLGTEVKLDMVLPLDKLKKLKGKKAKIVVNGAVMRIDKRGMAICFDENYQIIRVPE
jgi:hypothetical protein